MGSGMFIEGLGREVLTVRPGDSSSFGVHPHAGEVLWIGERFEDASPPLGREVDVTHGPVAEQQTEDVVADHRRTHDGR